MTKKCSRCEVEKSLDAFYKRPDRARCKECEAEIQLLSHRADPKKVNARNKSWRDRNPTAVRAMNLRSHFGISLEKYEALLSAQNGVCAICGSLDTSGKPLAVDRVHGSNPTIIRGLLCQQCNTAIGSLRDSPSNCAAAEAYILKFHPKH
jgi:hypothetical protein